MRYGVRLLNTYVKLTLLLKLKGDTYSSCAPELSVCTRDFLISGVLLPFFWVVYTSTYYLQGSPHWLGTLRYYWKRYLVAGERSDDENAQGEGEEVAGSSARLLIQALIDNGIINATNKATIRIIDNSKAADPHNDTRTIIVPAKSDLSDFRTLNLNVQQVQDHKPKRLVVQNQHSAGNFIRICQQNQNQVVLDNSATVGHNSQGNLVFPIISGGNLIRLSDGSLVIPVQRVDKETEERGMDSEPPPLLILPTEDTQTAKPGATSAQNCGEWMSINRLCHKNISERNTLYNALFLLYSNAQYILNKRILVIVHVVSVLYWIFSIWSKNFAWRPPKYQ